MMDPKKLKRHAGKGGKPMTHGFAKGGPISAENRSETDRERGGSMRVMRDGKEDAAETARVGVNNFMSRHAEDYVREDGRPMSSELVDEPNLRAARKSGNAAAGFAKGGKVAMKKGKRC